MTRGGHGGPPLQSMVYYSKKDLWLVGLVSGAIAIPILIGAYNLLVPGGHSELGWSSLFIGISTAAVVLWLTYPLYYEITSSVLKIRCGMLIRRQIPLNAITEVSPTKNPASAPAWSLDRLEVKYLRDGESRSELISPAEKSRFLQDLASSDAKLEFSNGRVVRRSSPQV